MYSGPMAFRMDVFSMDFDLDSPSIDVPYCSKCVRKYVYPIDKVTAGLESRLRQAYEYLEAATSLVKAANEDSTWLRKCSVKGNEKTAENGGIQENVDITESDLVGVTRFEPGGNDWIPFFQNELRGWKSRLDYSRWKCVRCELAKREQNPLRILAAPIALGIVALEIGNLKNLREFSGSDARAAVKKLISDGDLIYYGPTKVWMSNEAFEKTPEGQSQKADENERSMLKAAKRKLEGEKKKLRLIRAIIEQRTRGNQNGRRSAHFESEDYGMKKWRRMKVSELEEENNRVMEAVHSAEDYYDILVELATSKDV